MTQTNNPRSLGSLAAMASRGSMMDWEMSDMPEAPASPETLKEAGISLTMLNEMVLRTLLIRGTMLGLDLSRVLCLPFRVIEESLY
ncbi:MAG TPA: hypothetical protein PKD86_12265, partial [Gemmatales bacterium]|nr:hypothetical protein [Gemmatales bacterium]